MSQTPPKHSITADFSNDTFHAPDIDFLSATSSTSGNKNGKIVVDKATQMAMEDAKRVAFAADKLSSLLHVNPEGTTLNTNIKVSISSSKRVGDLPASSTILGLVEADYKGQEETNIRVQLDKEAFIIPVTHANMEKLAKAYDAGSAAVKAMTTRLQNGGTPLTEDAIFSGVSAAFKGSLKEAGLAK